MWGLTFILLLLGTFLVNIFFGYWRAGARTFSVPWFLAIHLPVPVVMGLRLVLLSWYPVQIPVFVVAYFAGQYTGGRVRKHFIRRGGMSLSANLVMDLWRNFRRAG